MINFGKAFGPNPGAELADAIGGAVANAPYQNAQLMAAGNQVLAQYKQMAAADPNLASDPNFIAKVTRISKMYGLPVPMMGTQGGSWDAVTTPAAAGTTDQGAPASAQPAAAASPTPAAAGGAPAQKPGMTVGSPAAPAAGSTQPQAAPQQYQDPRLKVLGAQYDTLLRQAAANPSLLRDATFDKKIAQAAAAVGRSQQLKADIQAYQQKAKAGAQTGAPAAGAPASGQPAGAQPAPAQGSGGQVPTTPPGATSTPPEGTESFMRPETEGPRRINLNAWLGRTMSAQEFGVYSTMTPDNRKQALTAAGWDTRDFSPTWLNSEPTLSPADQLKAANDAGIRVTDLIKQGAPIDDIKATLSLYKPFLSKEQVDGLEDQVSSQMTEALNIRLTQVQQTGMLRQATIGIMNRRLSDQERNTQWDHNFKYQVFNEKNAQWSAGLQVRRQQLQVSLARLQNDLAQNTQVKPGELMNTARGLLSNINTAVNEYNTRITAAIQAGVIDPKKGGVNPLMDQDIQNDIDAYNSIVDEMKKRGMQTPFNYYQGADQSSMNANTARLTAGAAVNAQGLATPGGAGAGGLKQVGTDKRNNKAVYQNAKGAYVYADGSPVPK